MVFIRHVRRRALAIGFLLLVVSVPWMDAQGARKPRRISPPPALSTAHIRLDLADLRQLDARAHGAPAGPELSAALASAQQQAAYSPGYDPVAGLVGGIIGVRLTQSIRDSRVQAEANKPIESLREQYDEQRATLRLEQALLEAMQRHRSDFGSCMAASGDASGCESELVLKPRIWMSCNYRCTELALHARWLDGRDREVYENRFEFRSDLLPADDSTGIGAWERNDMAALRSALSMGTEALAALLAQDLVTGRINLPPGETRNIRYLNDLGVFHERGQLLQEEPGRLVIRMIGGGLKSFPADRLLTTTEYYQHLDQLGRREDIPAGDPGGPPVPEQDPGTGTESGP